MLILSGIVFSCNGSYNKNLRETAVESPVFDPQTTYRDSTTPWVDPDFYIEGQLCQHVRKIFQDKSGNLWFGTNVYDIIRYNGDTLVYFTEKDGIGGGRRTGIVEDTKGPWH